MLEYYEETFRFQVSRLLENKQGRISSNTNYFPLRNMILQATCVLFCLVSLTTSQGSRRFKVRDNVTLHQRIQFYLEDGILNLNQPEFKYIGPVLNVPNKKDPIDLEGNDPRVYWKVPDLIRNGGNFTAQTHIVATEDDYYLTVFRIINKNCKPNPDIYPVYFQHGLMGTAADFLLLDPEFVLPFILAEHGHDVWLGNSRGNEYSMKHEYYHHKDPKFWNFSFHEMGEKDLPVFDYILEKTRPLNPGQMLNYVGHGLGTTMFYVCLSRNKKYNNNIQTMIGFAPTAYMSRSNSPLRKLAPFVKQYKDAPLDGPTSPRSLTQFLHLIEPELCALQKFDKSFCASELFFLSGFDKNLLLNNKTLPRIFGHLPSTTSIKTLVHYLQLFEIDAFREFDYGPVQNFRKYGQTQPPKYNIFRVEVQSVNFYGLKDELVEEQDAAQTISELGAQINKFNVFIEELGHYDFIFDELLGLGNFYNILIALESIYVKSPSTHE